MTLYTISIRRPVLAIVMSITIVLFGLLGFSFLGVREYPSLDPPNISVSTSYRGASADVIESQITEPIEAAVNAVDGIRTLTSTSRDGRSTVQTEFDRLGAEITVKRETGAPDIIQPVQYRRARPVLEFSRWESSNPRSRAETHVGTVNSSIWNGYAAEKVLCTGIVGTTRDGGDSFDVRYTFEVKADTLGWDTTVVYIDEDTGRPISPLVDTVSKKTIELYDTSNFGLLNISL